MDVQEVTDSLVDYYSKVEFFTELLDPSQVWCLEQWVSWKLAKQGEKLLASFASLLKIIKFDRRTMAVEDAASSKEL